MSLPNDQRAIARDTKQIIRSAGAALAGRERGADPVRRNSYDVGDPRAAVFVRIADGTKIGALGWREDLYTTAEEFDTHHKKPGERWLLGANTLRVYKAVLWKFLDFKTGRLEPMIRTLVEATKLSRNTVVAALKKLAQYHFIEWVRRSYKTGEQHECGLPVRKQAANAYFFRLERLPARALARFRQLQERRKRRHAGLSTPRTARSIRASEPLNEALRAALAPIATALGADWPTGNPI